MADGSKIEWTDATWNPLRGCSRVSEGCRHCYAEGVAARFSGPGQPYEGLARFVTPPSGPGQPGGAPSRLREARWTGKVAFSGDQVLTQPLCWKRPRRIFVNSMSDLFHESVPDAWIDRIFAVMALAPQHTFQVLTKRPERMRAYVARITRHPIPRLSDDVAAQMGKLAAAVWPHEPSEQLADRLARKLDPDNGGWPLPNVWLGVSVEDQVTADTRIPYLLSTPAAVRFISAEPLLGPVDVLPYLFIYTHADDAALADDGSDEPLPFHDPATTDPAHISSPRLDWVIVGGESGPHARPMHPGWARSLRDQCAAAGVPFFFKQWGEWLPAIEGDDGARLYMTPDDGGDEWRFDETVRGEIDRESFPDQTMWRVGKHRAGRLLDGVAHDGFPEVRHG